MAPTTGLPPHPHCPCISRAGRLRGGFPLPRSASASPRSGQGSGVDRHPAGISRCHPDHHAPITTHTAGTVSRGTRPRARVPGMVSNGLICQGPAAVMAQRWDPGSWSNPEMRHGKTAHHPPQLPPQRTGGTEGRRGANLKAGTAGQGGVVCSHPRMLPTLSRGSAGWRVANALHPTVLKAVFFVF